METENAKPRDLEPLVAEIVSSYVRKNHVAPDEMSAVINTVYQSLLAVSKPLGPSRAPAVPISRSVTRTYVVCLDCGWRAQTLTRHIRARHGLTENEYRARWDLPAKHRLNATAYSKKRSAWAKQLGLGRHKGGVEDVTVQTDQESAEPPSEKAGLSDKAQID